MNCRHGLKVTTRREVNAGAAVFLRLAAGTIKLTCQWLETQLSPSSEECPMTAENFDKALSGLKQRTPFRPFTVELIGGHRFEVDHPGALVVRDGVAVFILPGGVPVWFDHESVTQFVGDLRKKRKAGGQ
jgi:hypothetical protein